MLDAGKNMRDNYDRHQRDGRYNDVPWLDLYSMSLIFKEAHQPCACHRHRRTIFISLWHILYTQKLEWRLPF